MSWRGVLFLFFIEADHDEHRIALTIDAEKSGALGAFDEVLRVGQGADRGAIDFLDDVAFLDAHGGGAALGIHLFDEQAFDLAREFGLFAELRGQFLGNEAGDDFDVFSGGFAARHGVGVGGGKSFDRKFLQGGTDSDALAIAENFQGNGGAGLAGANHEAQTAAAVHTGAVGINDDITGFDAGFFGR